MRKILVILVAAVFVLPGICFSADLDDAQRKVNRARAEKKLEDKKDDISSDDVENAQRKVNRARAEKKLKDKKDDLNK